MVKLTGMVIRNLIYISQGCESEVYRAKRRANGRQRLTPADERTETLTRGLRLCRMMAVAIGQASPA
jgi:hypothetical protein